jgi:chromate transporter
LPLVREVGPRLALFDAFYRSGALVFGGGHVVLPLLNEAFVGSGWISRDDFLAGYGAAQATPGPLFSFGAYLGAMATPSPGTSGAALGITGIFLPAMLLLLGALPFWRIVCTRADTRAVMMGINAAVVGVLGAALCNPVWSSSVGSIGDAVLAVVGFLLLVIARVPPVSVVVLTTAGAMALSTYAAV